MKELIKSLNPEQQKELADLLRRDHSLNQATAGILEDHLSGNSTGYNKAFNDGSEISPSVAAFIANNQIHRQAAVDRITKNKVI